MGGGEDVRKIAWVDWDIVCLPKEEGGLRVRRLKEFNVALLRKWCWQMLVDKEVLWYRVLKARYGEEGGAVEGGRERLLGLVEDVVWHTLLCWLGGGGLV